MDWPGDGDLVFVPARPAPAGSTAPVAPAVELRDFTGERRAGEVTTSLRAAWPIWPVHRQVARACGDD